MRGLSATLFGLLPADAVRKTTRWTCGAALALATALSAAAAADENGYKHFIPYVPSPDFIVDRMLEMAEVGRDDYLIDLGSGDGRIPIAAAQKFGARALGVEIDPKLVEESIESARKAGVGDRVSFRVEDMFKTPIHEATVMTLYVLTAVNLKLRPRLLAELRPGTRVVSHAFQMGTWLPDGHENVLGIDIFLWIVPAKVAGKWELRDGAQRIKLDLTQNFQEIRGTATVGERTVPLLDASLRGDRIEFSLDAGDGQRRAFKGSVDGDRIGPDAGSDASAAWHAVRVSGTRP